MTTATFRVSRKLWIGSLFAASLAFVGAPRLLAQSQDDQSQSVAEAARKAKERKKAAAKNNIVITDDTIHLRPASADSSGAPPAGTVVTSNSESGQAGESGAKSPAPPADSTSKESDAKKSEKQQADVAKLKELLADVQKQLDLMKRKFDLDSDNFYSQPDYAHDTAGKAKLDELQKQIGDQEVAVDNVKQELERLMTAAGTPANTDKPAAPPQN